MNHYNVSQQEFILKFNDVDYSRGGNNMTEKVPLLLASANKINCLPTKIVTTTSKGRIVKTLKKKSDFCPTNNQIIILNIYKNLTFRK